MDQSPQIMNPSKDTPKWIASAAGNSAWRLFCNSAIAAAAGLMTHAHAASYTWVSPGAGTYAWESSNWDLSPDYPSLASDVANIAPAANATILEVGSSSITLGSLNFGTGGVNTIQGASGATAGTLVFDNGGSNATLTRGDVGTTNGGTMKFTTYQLNSSLNVDYSGTHITSMMIMQGKFTGSGSLNLKNVWGDEGWSGFVLDASDHDYTGGTTLDNATLTLNGTIDTGVTMSNNSLLKINKSGEQAQSSMMGGPITGSGAVLLAEGMTMIFDNNSNSWDGAVQTTGNFPQGLKFSSIKNVGEGPSALGNPLTVDNGRLQMRGVGGGTWEYTGSGDTTDRIFAINNATDLEWHTTLAASGTTTTASPFKITSNLEGNGASYFYLGGTGAGEWAGVLSDRPWRALRIRKVDSGTWTFSGANTYTDTTEVLGGTLILAPTGHLKFKVTNSSTNQVKGSGTAQFDGIFDIDTSAVTAFTGTWNIVKVDTLNESFGSTFEVAGFTQDPVDTNLWRMSDGPKNWTFDSTSGNLSLSAAAVITSFNYGIYAGIIDQGAKTISLVVANGTDIPTVNPTYVLSSGSCDQPSGGVPSPAFSVGGSVQYTVTDGDIVNVYTVSVNEAPSAPGGVSLGLALWLDATDASTMTLDGTTVNEWRDKFGGSNKATKGGGAPTLVTDASGPGALPTVRFNTSSWMNDGVNRAAGPVSIVLVARQTGGSNGRVLSSAGNNWLMGYWGGNRNCAYFEGWVQGPGQGSDTNPHLNVATIGGAGQNSTLYGADGSGNWVQLASNQNGTQGPNNLQLNGSMFGEHSDCDISEVIVYDRVLTNSEVTTLAGYLNTKYSLGIAMPAPTWAWNKPTAVGTYEWESANWDAPAYPNAQGIAARCFTQAGNNVWTMNNPITLGQLQFGGDTGAAHTINGTGTLVFDNGANNAVLSRGSDVSTTTGANINVADITLNSTLNVNISSHLTSVMTISSRIGGTGGLNIIEAWGDSGWPGLVLSGANTYTGNTTISNGTYTTRMTLTNTGSLKFAVTNAGSNKITGNGTAALNGSFVIDTSAVTATSGSWTLVDVSTPIYGGTFSVAGFDDSDGDNVWTKTDWNRNWTFTEATGVLGLVYTNTFTETTTVLDTSGTPSVEGQEVTFTASVMVDGLPETTATGSMVFRVDGNVVATVSPLVSGAASYSTSALAVGSHQITATYSGDSAFTPSVGTRTQVVNVAPDNPYQAWDGLYDADLSDPAADEDGDGRSNFEEFAFGLSPVDPASSNPIADISELRATGKFSYTRRVNSGLTYSILYSSDLQSWPQDEGANEEEVTPGPGENVETVTVGLSEIPASDRFFVRVQATAPAP